MYFIFRLRRGTSSWKKTFHIAELWLNNLLCQTESYLLSFCASREGVSLEIFIEQLCKEGRVVKWGHSWGVLLWPEMRLASSWYGGDLAFKEEALCLCGRESMGQGVVCIMWVLGNRWSCSRDLTRLINSPLMGRSPRRWDKTPGSTDLCESWKSDHLFLLLTSPPSVLESVASQKGSVWISSSGDAEEALETIQKASKHPHGKDEPVWFATCGVSRTALIGHGLPFHPPASASSY